MENNEEFMKVINRIANEILNPPASKTKGTSYWYYAGSVGNKSVCFTKAKTHYKGRYGFWSWVQTKYKKGITKRTKFALSRTKKKAETRADKLLVNLKGE